MHVVMDTVCMLHVLRCPRVSRCRRRSPDAIVTVLHQPLRTGKARLVVDVAGGLIDEWCDTCGREVIQVLVTKWEGFGAVDPVVPGKVPSHIAKNLRGLGFQDTIDKLILRIALATGDRTVVSDDSDFWDPAQPSKRGQTDAPVARLCRDKLQITVMLLKTFLRHVR